MEAVTVRIDPEKLRRLRERRVIGVRELGRLSGVSHDGIIEIEQGKRQPHAATIRKLAAALGVEPAELLADEGEQNGGQG